MLLGNIKELQINYVWPMSTIYSRQTAFLLLELYSKTSLNQTHVEPNILFVQNVLVLSRQVKFAMINGLIKFWFSLCWRIFNVICLVNLTEWTPLTFKKKIFLIRYGNCSCTCITHINVKYALFPPVFLIAGLNGKFLNLQMY